MKSAQELSKMIRMKKKAMQDDRGVVDLSGIPMDATDIDIMKQETLTKDLGLDTNDPKPRSEEPAMESPSHSTLMADSAERQAEVDPAKAKRRARIAAMMSK